MFPCSITSCLVWHVSFRPSKSISFLSLCNSISFVFSFLLHFLSAHFSFLLLLLLLLLFLHVESSRLSLFLFYTLLRVSHLPLFWAFRPDTCISRTGSFLLCSFQVLYCVFSEFHSVKNGYPDAFWLICGMLLEFASKLHFFLKLFL